MIEYDRASEAGPAEGTARVTLGRFVEGIGAAPGGRNCVIHAWAGP